MMDEAQANTTAIERMESLLYGLRALGQHPTRPETDHAKLVTLIILRNELEDLITVCKAGALKRSAKSPPSSRSVRIRLSKLGGPAA